MDSSYEDIPRRAIDDYMTLNNSKFVVNDQTFVAKPPQFDRVVAASSTLKQIPVGVIGRIFSPNAGNTLNQLYAVGYQNVTPVVGCGSVNKVSKAIQSPAVIGGDSFEMRVLKIVPNILKKRFVSAAIH